jgi:soluble lytic murein transglycosylase-like protein
MYTRFKITQLKNLQLKNLQLKRLINENRLMVCSVLVFLLIFTVTAIQGCFSSISKTSQNLSKEELLLQKMIRQREEIENIQNLLDEESWQVQFEKQKQSFDRKKEDYDHLMRTFQALINHPLYQAKSTLKEKYYKVEAYPAKILSKMQKYQDSTNAYLELSKKLETQSQDQDQAQDHTQSWINELRFFAAFQMYEIESYEQAISIFKTLARHQGKIESLKQLRQEGFAADSWIKNAEWYYAWSLYLMGNFKQSAIFLEGLLPFDSSTLKVDHKPMLYWASAAYEKIGQSDHAMALRQALLSLPKLDYYSILTLKKYPTLAKINHLYPTPQRKQFFVKKFETEISNLDLGKISAHQVFSFILKESNFNPKAKSPAQAFGLMQLLEKTASALVAHAQTNHPTNQVSQMKADSIDLYDPRVNLILGTYYLNLLNAQYLEQMPLVAIAYNAGPVALKTWMDRQRMKGNQVALDLFIEKIPYKEAREYVKKIIEFETHYEMLYAQESFENLAKSIPMLLNLKIKETILF